MAYSSNIIFTQSVSFQFDASSRCFKLTGHKTSAKPKLRQQYVTYYLW